ncbi:right-handed parallel beta-helix repeat-containing protein [Alkalicoccobacillus porphyridii]|uniref:DUF1565 domain-containing protein n=1 Tax=Alkalicoccobacillus porphyridii TaxID=2597270 RepID=A0A553ZWC1_9BACI|nr:right-handed parallel beta-helix repeat-containing protein [Alkalicoccobacillus porphyridii]TSB45757.1 DUF1565 domain-containing protein [Alkalicoccobacillus porphyridii]
MKRKYELISMLVMVFILTGCQLNVTTEVVDPHIYVATDGDDKNPGTIEEPLLSLEAAAEKATAGTIVNIREGTYYEPLIIQHSGTETEPVQFQAYQDEEVHISGAQLEDGPDDIALIEVDGYSYITIDGLAIADLTTENAEKTVMGILITGDSQHIQLSNNTIEDISTYAIEGNAHGIAVYGNEAIGNIDIHQNTLTNLKLGLSEALVVNGDVSQFTITENHVYETDNIGIDVIGYEGVATNSSQDYARDGVISGNEVHHNSSFENPSYAKDYSAAGIYVDGGSRILIEDNIVYQNDIGIEATSEHKDKFADEIDILNNEVYENSYTGISIGGYDSQRGGTSNTLISGNTLIDNDTEGLEGAQLLFQYHTYSNRIEHNKMTASSTGLFISNEYQENEDTHFSQNYYYQEDQTRPRWLWRNEDAHSLKDFQMLTDSDAESVYTRF